MLTFKYIIIQRWKTECNGKKHEERGRTVFLRKQTIVVVVVESGWVE